MKVHKRPIRNPGVAVLRNAPGEDKTELRFRARGNFAFRGDERVTAQIQHAARNAFLPEPARQPRTVAMRNRRGGVKPFKIEGKPVEEIVRLHIDLK